MNEKYKSLLNNTIIFAVGSIGSKLILFLLVPLYTNSMSTAEYGIADLVFTVGQILIPFLSAGVFSAVIRFGISIETRHQDVLRNALIVVAVGSTIMVVLAPMVGFYDTLSDWKWFLSAYVITELFASVELNYLKAKEQNKTYTAIGLGRTLVLALANVLLLLVFNTGVKGYLLSTIIASIFAIITTTIFGHLFKDIKESKRDYYLLKEMLVYSAPLILNGISWWVIHSSDKIMIEYMINAAALGLYAVAGKIPSVINVIVSIFSQAWDISSIKEVESTKDTGFFDNVFKLYSFLVFFVTILAITLTKAFMQIYVGPEFRQAWLFVPLLLVSAAFGALGSYFGSFFGALKKSNLSMWSTLLAAVINILINFILIPHIGIWGAVISTLSAYTVMMIFRIVSVLKYININIHPTVFIINCLLVLIQAILISLDYFNVFVSLLCLIVFAFINRESVKEMSIRIRNIKRKQFN